MAVETVASMVAQMVSCKVALTVAKRAVWTVNLKGAKMVVWLVLTVAEQRAAD